MKLSGGDAGVCNLAHDRHRPWEDPREWVSYDLHEAKGSLRGARAERRYAAMRADGYYWRPAHVPHGHFWT